MGDKKVEHLLSSTSQLLYDQIEQKKVIFIISNSTVDGIISSSILFDSIYRLGGCAVIRCHDSANYSELKDRIRELITEGHDSYILVDFDSNIYNDIVDSITKEKYFLFINADKNLTKQDPKENENIVCLNINNSKNVSDLKGISTVSTLVYHLVKGFDRKITQVSYLPIVAEISKFSKANINNSNYVYDEILQTAITLNLVEKKKDLIFVDKQTSSVISALEGNISHFIKGLTWNRQASIEVLKKSGISFAENKRVKSLSEFEERDYDEIVSSIEKFVEKRTSDNSLADSDAVAKKNVKEKLLAYNYVLTNEESNSILKGAYSFSRVLESCIRRKRYGIALAILLGDRYNLLSEVQNQIQTDKSILRKIGSKIFAEKWRFYEDKEIIFVNGEGIVDEKDIVQFAELLGKSLTFSDKIVCIRTTGTENEEMYKYTVISGDSVDLDSTKLKNKIREFIESQGLPSMDRYDIKYHNNDEGINLEIIVPMKELEVFLSNIKKIVLDARIP
ncbi:MAG TPA: hypothetical protein VFT71_06900 [Candidatus Nitrosocosmicus sp.]|nr:hypothetical protein [Candidatus Nitrosocosmicus sp.]